MKGAGDEQQNGAQYCERSAGSNSTIPSHEFHDESSSTEWIVFARRTSSPVAAIEHVCAKTTEPRSIAGNTECGCIAYDFERYPCPVLGTLDPALALNTSHRLLFFMVERFAVRSYLNFRLLAARHNLSLVSHQLVVLRE
jgi:hypothetical protein